MSIKIRYVIPNGTLDGVTDVSELATYTLDPNDPGAIVGTLQAGEDFGIVNIRDTLAQIQRPIDQGGLGKQIVKKSAALQRGFGVALDDFLVSLGLIRFTTVPGAPPTVHQRDGATDLLAFTVNASVSDTSEFLFGVAEGSDEPALILTGQSLALLDTASLPAEALEVVLYLVPIDDPDAYVSFGRAVGPPGPPGTFVQEAIAAETITAADTVLAAGLSVAPFDVASVALYRDGAFMKQGATFDYQLQGATNQDILWLASTGTAPDMTTADVLVAKYNA